MREASRESAVVETKARGRQEDERRGGGKMREGISRGKNEGKGREKGEERGPRVRWVIP